jgi:hypothetical protein
MTLDVTAAIKPKSDQLNADNLITGPRTIRIREVRIVQGEQPIHVFFDGDDGKPWKPSKTSARCMATIWGSNAEGWVGLSLMIFLDPTVTWSGAAVGGIRISHMEGLDKPRSLMLTKTRGQKGAVVIKPLEMGGKDRAPVDVEAAKNGARDAALGGKEGFSVWWKANADKRDAIASIMPAIKAIAAAADAAQLEKQDSPPADEAPADETPADETPPPLDEAPDGPDDEELPM